MVHIMFQEMESRKHIVHVLSVVVRRAKSVAWTVTVTPGPSCQWPVASTGSHGADLSGPRGEKKPEAFSSFRAIRVGVVSNHLRASKIP